MDTRNQHRILIASDGSPSARAALTTAVRFPWGDASVARLVVARFPWLHTESAAAHAALDEAAELTAEWAKRDLEPWWPQAEARVVNSPPADAILDEAQRFGATTIALGWRGHGTFQRLLMGSTSRTVAEAAPCSVLVVREAPPAVHRLVVAYDGSPNAQRAIDFLTTLAPGLESHAVVVYVVHPVSLPASISRLPSHLRAQLRHAAHAESESRMRQAQTAVDDVVARLESVGWAASGDIRVGAPVLSLLEAVEEHRADVLVAGARATEGLERILLGSVAAALLDRSQVPVLLAR